VSAVRNSQLVVWVVLVAATLLSWAVGVESGSAAASLLVLVVACVKVRLVGRHFMELRGAHRALRALLDVYVVVLGIAMSAVYLAA
jgi:hypothetical protein